MTRSLASPYSTHLTNRAFIPVDLYELTVGGTTYRFTTFGANLTGIAPAAVATYTAGMMMAQGQRQAAGLVADDLEVEVLHGGTEQLGGKSWVARALDGDLDGAPFKRFEGCVDPTTSLLVGCAEVFVGQVSNRDPTSTRLRLVVSVPSKRFNAKFPALTVQPGCVWDLGSAGCGWAGTLDHTATLAAGSTASLLKAAATPGGLSGPNLFLQGAAFAGGYRRAITDTATVDGGVTFRPSPPFPPGVIEGLIGSAGALTLRRGCNKTSGVCDSWYSNISNFLGAPRAPSEKDAT